MRFPREKGFSSVAGEAVSQDLGLVEVDRVPAGQGQWDAQGPRLTSLILVLGRRGCMAASRTWTGSRSREGQAVQKSPFRRRQEMRVPGTDQRN